MKQVRIGIIGTGRIARRFVAEAHEVPEAILCGAYNPRQESAEEFVRECALPIAAENLAGLFALCDAVYIATPHETHGAYVREALDAGKHVLCEKPLCFSGKEAEELFALAKARGVVLMEGIKTAYCPGFLGILDAVKSGIIGEVVDVEAAFTRLTPANVREVWDREYGGSFTEFGTYPCLPILKLLGTGEAAVRFASRELATGADGYTKAFFDFGERFALAKTGLSAKTEGQLVIAGTRGYLLAASPWWLTKSFELRFEDADRREVREFSFEGAGLRYEISAFFSRISGKEDARWVTPEESIRLAELMGAFLAERKEAAWNRVSVNGFRSEAEQIRDAAQSRKQPGIWAHRGCCLAYPENTLPAFIAAAKLPGLIGIELDVQLTKDGELVVIHDETVDRTTDGHGEVRSFSLSELKKLRITGSRCSEAVCPELHIPTLREVFEAVLLQLREGLLINIEMKNSKIRYEGMEEKVLALVAEYGLEKNIIYSSFLPESMKQMKALDPSVKTGILGNDVHWCIKKAIEMGADAVHPWIGGLDTNPTGLSELPEGMGVRCWNMEEPFYGDGRVLREYHMEKYGLLGATDVIVNVPEMYLGSGKRPERE